MKAINRLVHDQDIRSYGPCLRPYHLHGDRDGHSANRLNSGISVKESAPFLRGRSAVKAEKFEVNREAMQALALSVAGVNFAMLIWSLMMLLWY